jgi:hypothetical protein
MPLQNSGTKHQGKLESAPFSLQLSQMLEIN